VHHYNLACIEAQAGGPRLPHAWGALDLAVALGFNDAEHLRTDPDLEPLRSDPRFADVVRKIMYNATAGAAVAAISIPERKAPSQNLNSSASTAEPSATASVGGDIPIGLFLMFRYSPATQRSERSVWFFASDRTVYRDLREGFSRSDLATHAGRKGTASRTGRILEIRWADGETSAAKLERDGNGFLWDMAIFTPASAFENADDVAGVYEGSETFAAGPEAVPGASRLEFRKDGTFAWNGVSFDETKTGALRYANAALTRGRWELNGFSLLLTAGEGRSLRRFAIPYDDEKTVIRPDEMYFGGVMYKRRP
jgi:hypothetical protein